MNSGEFRRFFIALLLIVSASSATISAQPRASASQIPFMELRITIDPQTQTLEASATISELTSATEQVFFLNKKFKIKSVTVDGKPIEYTFDLDGEVPTYARVASPLKIKAPADEISIQYSGSISEVIAGVNMISPDLVELALYSAFHPFNLQSFQLMTYDLYLTLPSTFKVVANGELVRREIQGGETTHVFQERRPSIDIPIVASPSFQVESRRFGEVTVEMFHSDNAWRLVDGRLETMGKALMEFERRFGKSDASDVLRCVYSPRGGWGYIRFPIFVVSEIGALEALNDPFDNQMAIRYNIHEIAHFWWSIAAGLTNEDWINEGLAEYSALSYTVPLYGEAFRTRLLKGYLADISKARTDNPIVATPLSSPDREVNWYKKTALLLHVFEKKVGKEKLDRFLSTLNMQFQGTRAATTADFLEIAQEHFDEKELHVLKGHLTSSGWSEEQLKALAEAAGIAELP